MSIPAIVQQGRRLSARTLLDRAVIQDRATVRDSSGGQRITFTARPEPVRCAFATVTDEDLAAVSGVVQGKAKAILRTSLDVVIEEGARVVSQLDGSVWSVIGDRTPPSNLATVRRFVIQEV